MRTIVAVVSGFVVALIAVTSLSAKGTTTRITLRGGNLTTPIDITDAAILKEFDVWAGPGVSVNGVEQTEGFIIDWSSGIMARRPLGLPRYEVSFYVNLPNRAAEQPTYVVLHEYDPSAKQAYVYLPGRGDEQYELNTSAMFHGHNLEGNWFRATSRWQGAVTPLIAQHAIPKP